MSDLKIIKNSISIARNVVGANKTDRNLTGRGEDAGKKGEPLVVAAEVMDVKRVQERGTSGTSKGSESVHA